MKLRSVAVEWRPVDRLTLSAQLRGHGRYFSDDANSPERRIGGGAIADAKGSYDFGKVTLSAYARNVTDRFQLTYKLSPTLATAADPREFGLELEGRF